MHTRSKLPNDMDEWRFEPSHLFLEPINFTYALKVALC